MCLKGVNIKPIALKTRHLYRPETFIHRWLKPYIMKNTLKCWICFLLTAIMATSLLAANHPSYYEGLPGDDFSLEGALDLFKRSNSLEEFERQLNSDDNNVNNLDLNNNGRIDYLRVLDHAEEGDLHTIVIQAVIDQGISQDVAVIEVKRNRNGEAVVQIVGDEDLYGTAKIVEPYPYDDMVGTDYYDNYYDHYSPTVFVNAWAWPSVQFIFAPRYVVWVSPYYYDYYPSWYRPWNPHPYHVWHTRTVVYNRYYCVAPNYRIPEARHYYGARRVSAPIVHQRTERYVAEHGGRSNFDYTKRNDRVDAPRGRSLNPSERSATSTRTNRQQEQSPTTKPQVSNRDSNRSPQRDATTPATRQREQNLEQQGNRKESAPTKSKAGNSNRQSATPTRETTPRTNSSINKPSSPAAPTRIDRQPTAASKADRPATNSRTSLSSGNKAERSNGSVNKPAVKTERSQPRKGKG